MHRAREASMAIETRISEEEYQQIVLASPDRQLEMHAGRLREKPGMTWEHGDIAFFLGYLLQLQLDRRLFRIAVNDWRVRRLPGTIYIPDIVVVPTDYGLDLAGRPGALAIFSDPLPLVVEVWSSSTGDYDIDTKLPEYQRRGDLEIWRVHPYERTLTVWRRLSDGSYDEAMYREGVVNSTALPGVEIDLTVLFEV
jgi:Uma2 family endonuclease